VNGVRVEAVSRRFGRVQAVDQVDLEVAPGEVLGLLGPNGAGKTTTIRLITGFLRPDTGRITVGGVDTRTDPRAASALIGYVPESAAVPREFTVRGYLAYCTKLRSMPRAGRRQAVTKAIERAGLGEVAGQTIGTLSKGYRQRVALAQAIVHDPPVLILDEPTVGLDPRQVAEARALIARLGRRRAVLFSSHLLGEVSTLCKRVVIINHGRVVATKAVDELTTAADKQRLELRVTQLDRAATVVGALPDVMSVQRHADRLVVLGRGDDLGQRVSAAVVGAGLGLLELKSDTGSLEEAYLRIVTE